VVEERWLVVTSKRHTSWRGDKEHKSEDILLGGDLEMEHTES
jgi:hypothetical protein